MVADRVRILFFAPGFHGYSRAIADALSRRGHIVDMWLYDALPGSMARIRHKLVHELPDRLDGRRGFEAFQRRMTQFGMQRLNCSQSDVLLVIKGDVFLPEFWLAARQRVGVTHLWLYDEVRRMHHTPGIFSTVDRLSTYSRLDQARLKASGLDCAYIPNAFDDHLADVRPAFTEAFVFVGARYQNRVEMLASLHGRGFPVLAVGRGWSHHPYDRARTWEWRRPALPARRDMSRADAYGLMAGAIGNLNSHFDQDGFTMRTFEIPGMGGLQFIDRADVSEFYEPGEEVLVYHSLDELAELCQRAMRDRAWAASIGARARRRTLAEHTFAHRVPLLEEQWA